MPDPLIGRVLQDRYTIVSLIDQGGMGRVYLAEQERLGRSVAVKVLDLVDPHGEYTSRFVTEAAVQGKLTHPNTARIFDYGRTEDGVTFIVMELLRGETLKALIAREAPLKARRVVRMGRQLCGALAEAHALGLVHRDLKPGNIYVTTHQGKEHVKILDFGLVKDTTTDLSLSTTGQALGSPMYMAPEQVEASDVDARADVYALGIVLWCALTGKKPYDSRTATRVLMDQLQTPIARLSVAAPNLEIPPELDELIARCVEKGRTARPAGVEVVDQRLEEIEDGLRGDSTSRSSPAMKPPSRAPVMLGVVSVLLLASVLVVVTVATTGGLAVWFSQPEEEVVEAVPRSFTREVLLDACHTVVLEAEERDQLHARIETEGEPRVGILGRKAVAETVVVEVEEGRVRVRLLEHEGAPVKVVVFCPALHALEAGKSDTEVGRLDVADFRLHTDSGWVTMVGGAIEVLNLEIVQSADVDLGDVSLGTLTSTQRGSGDLTAKGSVEQLIMVQRSSGDSKLLALDAVNADVHLFGSGDCELTVRGTLKATSEGSGDVQYAGNPKNVAANALNSGMVRPAKQ